MRIIRDIHRDGEERIVSFFAFWPVTLKRNGKFETRWLERVTIRQEFKVLGAFAEWHNIEFVSN
ncbi:MAG: hypothetical protein WC565_05795 [Parcubacteria group bacterium]|jgi:hypothetical protein